MKNLIFIALLLTFLRASAAVTLMVQTNGALAGPTNFFTANSNAVTSAAVGKLSKTGDSISGTFAVTNSDLTFDADPVAPNTNRTRNFTLSNFGIIQNSQADTVSWTGRNLGEIYGGTMILGAITNLILDIPDSYGDFTDVTKLLALGPIDPATGLRVTRAYTLDQLGLTDTSFSGKVIGIDAATKRVTKSSVAITDVASASATLAKTNGTGFGLALNQPATNSPLPLTI